MKEERNYKCQRCFNHKETVLRKGHICYYKQCKCALCNLNNERRKINKDLRNNRKNNASEIVSEEKDRSQHCTLCKNHAFLVPLKGHKKKCPYKDCVCQTCCDAKKHRKIMAEQTKNRRRQGATKKMTVKRPATPKAPLVVRPIPNRPVPPINVDPNTQVTNQVCSYCHYNQQQLLLSSQQQLLTQLLCCNTFHHTPWNLALLCSNVARILY